MCLKIQWKCSNSPKTAEVDFLGFVQVLGSLFCRSLIAPVRQTTFRLVGVAFAEPCVRALRLPVSGYSCNGRAPSTPHLYKTSESCLQCKSRRAIIKMTAGGFFFSVGLYFIVLPFVSHVYRLCICKAKSLFNIVLAFQRTYWISLVRGFNNSNKSDG